MSFVTPPGVAENRVEPAATWATRLADGPMPADQNAEFQAWLDEDPANGAALEEVVATWEAVEHYAASEPVMALREAALASARKSFNQRPRASSPQLIWSALAASLVLVLGAAGAWAWLTPRTYETGLGERRVVALSDGSKVSLDANTVVKVRFTADDRRLWLERGRAKFEVAKNPLRPFSVRASDEVVVATGTAFSVEMVQNQVHVVLYEGHVALLRGSGSVTRPTLAPGAAHIPVDRLLIPGREVILPQFAPAQIAAIPASVQPADPVRSLAWEGGELVFDDEKLGVVVERMNRYAEKPLVIGDAAAANLKISGVFRAGDTDALVQGLSTAFDVRAQAGPTAIKLFKDEPHRVGG